MGSSAEASSLTTLSGFPKKSRPPTFIANQELPLQTQFARRKCREINRLIQFVIKCATSTIHKFSLSNAKLIIGQATREDMQAKSCYLLIVMKNVCGG